MSPLSRRVNNTISDAASVSTGKISLVTCSIGSSEKGTHLINKEWVRWLLVTGWQGATKEHSQQCSVTEEQRSQPVIRSQPSGLPCFAATASLLVGQRSLRIFSLLAPRGAGKSRATHPFPIYEMSFSAGARNECCYELGMGYVQFVGPG